MRRSALPSTFRLPPLVPPSAFDLQPLVRLLADDLLARATENAEIDAGLREAFQQIEKGGRTAQAYEVWREDYLDQVAVAWVLACVFVRFMEDNHLIDECWLAGEKDRRKLAEDAHELFFRKHPHDTDREYFQHVFREVGKIPAAKDLFAEGKTPLWAVAPSGDAAMKLLAFWREMDPETGTLLRRFGRWKDEGGRRNEEERSDSSFHLQPSAFLGDLYQDLSERARKKYALLQTPVFVEEFILDRTLEPAIDEFGLDKVRMIDPTCGSGHFLLGGFARLFDQWIKRESNEIVAAQKALDGVWGVDINPFAVAIARFRLIVAAVQACGIKRLKQAPAWTIHLAAGDSLLFGSRPGYKGERSALPSGETLFDVDPIYAVEDRQAVNHILDQGYHAVVGNPPYITVKDKAQNEACRSLYSTCYRQYSLGVPFTQRFWELAIQPSEPGASATGVGYVGMITANSFMKREFGKKLIEEFFPKIDLTHVIDTSGAYIPGHGTPTVILLGRARKPVGETVRAVLGIKGEPATPEDPSQGLVWQSIDQQIDRAGAQDEFTSTADVPRATLANHPWSIGGGGAADLMEMIDSRSEKTLGDLSDSIGRTSVVGEDDCWIIEHDVVKRHRLDPHCKSLGVGDCFRDWSARALPAVIYPYAKIGGAPLLPLPPELERWLWTHRTLLEQRTVFGKSMEEQGKYWYEHLEHYTSKFRTPLSVAFAFVATHNHFVLDRGGKVFKQSAPIIKLRADATEDDHLALLGLLNSSTACFWMKQALHDKGGGGIGGGLATEFWEHFFEFTGTGLQRFPIPETRSLQLARQLDKLGQEYVAQLPESVVKVSAPTATRLEQARTKAAAIRGQMIALQEELDWQCYKLYGLTSDNLRYDEDDLPETSFGQRAFEIVMGRQIEKGQLETAWFERHGAKPITETPSHWPTAYRKLVERRIKAIETNKEIALIEKPEYKRRWLTEPWEEQEQRALRNWLLDRLEAKAEGGRGKEEGTGSVPPSAFRLPPSLFTTAQLADKASGDHEFMQVAALYRGRPDFDVTALVTELVSSESVPFLPILRYKPSGLRKRALWEQTWELQRQQDKAEGGKWKAEKEELPPSTFSLPPSDIPVPPKYATADFQKTDYWRLRGKLDVPKERWISYPHCSTDSDPTLLIGWAGWDHLHQATALVHYYDARKREGWNAKRLTPLLAGLDQLLPWIHQWHPEIDPEFGETAGQSFQTMLEHDAHELGLTLDEIRNWQPPAKGRRGRARAGAKKTEDDE